jgi:hypothetical protein
MSAPRLLEATEQLVTDAIKQNIASAIADVRTENPTGSTPQNRQVNVILPQTYFNYVDATDYKLPAVFVIGRTFNSNQSKNAANFISGQALVQCSVIVEDRTSMACNTQAYRYSSAIYGILEQANLSTSDERVKCFVRVSRVENSDLFTKSSNKSLSESIFRKEIAFYLEVDHSEYY